MKNCVPVFFVKIITASLFLIASASVTALPLKGSLGITGSLESIDYKAEKVFFSHPGWAEVTVAKGDFLDDFDVEVAGPGGQNGSWVNYNDFGASSAAGDVLWFFDKGYNNSVDIWFELSHLYSSKFDEANGTMEILGRGFLTDGVDKVKSYWSFNATQKGGSIVYSSAFAVAEPESVILLLLGLVVILTNRKLKLRPALAGYKT